MKTAKDRTYQHVAMGVVTVIAAGVRIARYHSTPWKTANSPLAAAWSAYATTSRGGQGSLM
jgi:hypothetical protein